VEKISVLNRIAITSCIVLCSDNFSWPEMEDIKRSGVRAHVFLIIQCTIQISGSVLANTKLLFIFTSIAR
jgi:hypothetical protein